MSDQPTAGGGPSDAPPSPTAPPTTAATAYPIQYSVDYPARQLNRVTTGLRIFTAIPILIVAAVVAGGGYAAGGLLFFGPLLLVLGTLFEAAVTEDLQIDQAETDSPTPKNEDACQKVES